MKQFCMKIDLISQRENVLFLPSNMAAMTSHENALWILIHVVAIWENLLRTKLTDFSAFLQMTSILKRVRVHS